MVYMIPDLIISSGFKFLGYRMGKAFGTKTSKAVNENIEWLTRRENTCIDEKLVL